MQVVFRAELADPFHQADCPFGTHDFVDGEWMSHDLYDRAKLLANNQVPGPALIEEATTVTVVRRGHCCKVDRLGNLVITRA